MAQEPASSSVHSRSRKVCTSRSSVYRWGRQPLGPHLPTGHGSGFLWGMPAMCTTYSGRGCVLGVWDTPPSPDEPLRHEAWLG